MQALKALVIFMGVIIVIGVTVVGVTIYNRLNRAGSPPAAATTTASAPATSASGAGALPAFGEVNVPLPEPCRVVEMVPAGERLLLRLGSVARCNRILVIELATGRQLGAIDLAPPQQN